MKILIVEDSATLRHSMFRYISNAGHTPILAENGESALQILDTTDVDMVVMDVEMPGLDGFETTRCIRDWFGEVWIPIIFVTGKNEEQDLRQGIDAGGDDYLIKPISETILLAKIRAMERITAMRDQLNELNKELTKLSERDSLTHMFNRRTFEKRAADQWRIATRTKEPLAVLLMDIDHFKAYNDYYGHIAGDDCIVKVANAIEESLSRPGDIVARYGGEEFIALLPNTREDGAFHVAERIRHSVESLGIKHRESSTSSYVTMSVGGAVVTHTAGTRFLDQIDAADKAMYAAKQAGRNRVTVKLFNPKTLILVGEPTATTLKSIDGKLTNHCAMLQIHSGEEALDTAVRNRPDVIILDEDLGGMGGISAAREIRKHPLTAHTPILMLVNAPNDKFTDPSQGIEAEACFIKPASDDDLIGKLNELLFLP